MMKPLRYKPGSLVAVTAATFLAALLPLHARAVGSWLPVTAASAPSSPGHMLLMPNGTVMVQSAGATGWSQLSPGAKGGYTNGIWSTLASMTYSREFYASAVMQNGFVLVAGGEYGNGGKYAEIYNPYTNGWSVTPSAGVGLGDAESVLLNNGNVLVSPVGWLPYPQYISLIYNPTLNTWTTNTPSFLYQNECSWVKLPDDSILTVDDNTNATERYIPSLSAWVHDAPTPALLWDTTNHEIGASLLLSDGRVLCLGGSGKTAFYTPSGNTNQGSWTTGKDFPNGYVTQDAPAAMMVNGKILFVCSTATMHNPFYFYEYDPVADTYTQVPIPTGGLSDTNIISDRTSMLDLPDGTVLFNDQHTCYVYVPDPSPLSSGKPSISSYSWNPDGSIHLSGTKFNGISQGVGYGDDCQQDSNYPLVRFTDTGGNVYYGQTYNWSSTSVMTGSKVVTTECSLPSNVFSGPGTFSMQVVANGNASDPITFYGPVWVDFNYSGLQNGSYSFPYETLAGGTNAVLSGGTIAINATTQPSDSHETMTISKPMTITSVYGPSTIGH